jgi:hypothetical protein
MLAHQFLSHDALGIEQVDRDALNRCAWHVRLPFARCRAASAVIRIPRNAQQPLASSSTGSIFPIRIQVKLEIHSQIGQ